MALSSDPDDEEESEYNGPPKRVKDIDDTVQRKSVELILDVHKAVQDTALNIDELATIEGLDEETANQMVHHRVEWYIRELRPVMEDHPNGEKYLKNVELGTVDFNRPTPEQAWFDHRLKSAANKNQQRQILKDGPPNSLGRDIIVLDQPSVKEDRVSVTGLETIIHNKTVVSKQYDYRFDVRREGEIKHTVIRSTSIPRHVLLEAFDKARTFAREAGIGVRFQDVVDEEAEPF